MMDQEQVDFYYRWLCNQSDALENTAAKLNEDDTENNYWDVIEHLLRAQHLLRCYAMRMKHPPGKKDVNGRTEIPF